LLPSEFLKFVGVCLLAIGVYDTNVYRYALTTSLGTFDFFGRELPAKHPVVKIGFSVVLLFYYTVGLVLLILG
jgi:hypothetical protein